MKWLATMVLIGTVVSCGGGSDYAVDKDPADKYVGYWVNCSGSYYNATTNSIVYLARIRNITKSSERVLTQVVTTGYALRADCLDASSTSSVPILYHTTRLEAEQAVMGIAGYSVIHTQPNGASSTGLIAASPTVLYLDAAIDGTGPANTIGAPYFRR